MQVVVAVVVVGRQLLPRNALQVALYHEINNKKQKQQRDEKLGRAGQGTGPGSGSDWGSDWGSALAWLGSGSGLGSLSLNCITITAGSHQQAVPPSPLQLPVCLSHSQSLSQATKAAGNFCLCLHLGCGSRNSCLTPINWLPRQSPFGCSARGKRRSDEGKSWRSCFSGDAGEPLESPRRILSFRCNFVVVLFFA